MAEHAPDGLFEHVANLAGLQSSERVPLELGRVLMVHAVEKQHVQVRMDSQVARASRRRFDRRSSDES
jgi:hypothetical protein